MAAVFNEDKKAIAEARARILNNRRKVIPTILVNHLYDEESDFDSYDDDDADCIIE